MHIFVLALFLPFCILIRVDARQSHLSSTVIVTGLYYFNTAGREYRRE